MKEKLIFFLNENNFYLVIVNISCIATQMIISFTFLVARKQVLGNEKKMQTDIACIKSKKKVNKNGMYMFDLMMI